MIGPEWAGESSGPAASLEGPRRVAVVTGTRAEFGLLRPIMHAVKARADLELLCIAAGAHLVSPALTFHEVKREFPVADSIPMQVAGRTGRSADVEALGKGIARFGRSFSGLRPDWVVVLGDRIEAFAAASAAAVGGFALAHVHGGDRAEGVADESMRHAITKLAHLHLAATEQSGERIRRMGERGEDVLVVGSPAIDGLDALPPLGEARFAELGSPAAVLLMHPIGRSDEAEEHAARQVLDALEGVPTLALHPNLDPGRDGIMRALMNADPSVHVERHLVRDEFCALLRRLGSGGGVLVGNSSAGLIEAAVLGVPSVDVGARQGGRERVPGATVWAAEDSEAIREALAAARRLDMRGVAHPYADGRAGVRIAEALARHDPYDPRRRRKRSVF